MKVDILIRGLSFPFKLILMGPCYNFIMDSITALSPSPSKRTNFRSKTKLKDLASTM